MNREIDPLELNLGKMPSGFFWYRWGTVVSREEGEKLYKAELAPKRAAELHMLIDEAARALHELACPGVQDWMEPRRARN